jgi:hypothetical protein
VSVLRHFLIGEVQKEIELLESEIEDELDLMLDVFVNHSESQKVGIKKMTESVVLDKLFELRIKQEILKVLKGEHVNESAAS